MCVCLVLLSYFTEAQSDSRILIMHALEHFHSLQSILVCWNNRLFWGTRAISFCRCTKPHRARVLLVCVLVCVYVFVCVDALLNLALAHSSTLTRSLVFVVYVFVYAVLLLIGVHFPQLAARTWHRKPARILDRTYPVGPLAAGGHSRTLPNFRPYKANKQYTRQPATSECSRIRIAMNRKHASSSSAFSVDRALLKTDSNKHTQQKRAPTTTTTTGHFERTAQRTRARSLRVDGALYETGVLLRRLTSGSTVVAIL